MKSKQRQEIADLAAKRFDRMKKKRQDEAQQRTGHENLKLILGMNGETARAEPEPEPKPQIVLYLKDGVNPADRNFTKYPNEIHPVINERLQDMSEGVLYVYLWRQSWGFGKNYCRVSHKTVVKNTLIRSRSTAQKAMNALIDRRFVVKALTKEGSQDVDQTGALYRILTPSEVTTGRTEEGVLLEDLPAEGVPMVGIPIKGTPVNTDKQDDDQGIPINGTPNERYTDDRYTDNKHTSVPTIGIPMNGTLEAKPHDERPDSNHTDNRYTDNQTPLKEDSLKDSLSPDPVKAFYTGIGQARISKAKREKGIKVIQELEADGFSLEDIAYAAEWTPKNAKEEVYDMEILKHTIGEAISAKSAEQEAAHKEREQSARVIAVEEEEQRLESEILKIREGISKAELDELRERALEEIRNTDGVKEQFISEPLITAKENEILRRN